MTHAACTRSWLVMLQHNITGIRGKAHVAHAAMVGMHAFCCGLPALAMAGAALTGIASGGALLPDLFGELHNLLHAHEVWIFALSTALVVSGAVLEARARRAGEALGFPWLFAFSVACFLANTTLIVVHRAG